MKIYNVEAFVQEFSAKLGNCKAFPIMIEKLLSIKSSMVINYIIYEFRFVDRQYLKYYKNLPPYMQIYYRSTFINNMKWSMEQTIQHNFTSDAAKAECHSYVRNVLNTYLKIHCKI